MKSSLNFISIFLLVLSLTSCGGSSSGNNASPPITSSASTSASSTSSSSPSSNRAPLVVQLQARHIDSNSISIDAAELTDPDGDPLTFETTLNGTLMTSAVSDNRFVINELSPSTNYVLSLKVSDTQGLSVTMSLSFNTLPAGEKISLYDLTLGQYKRRYGLFSPSNSQHEKLPLVISFHGAGGSLPPQIITDEWKNIASREKFYLLEPAAVKGNYESFTFWNAGLGADQDDETFIKEMLNQVLNSQDIDTDRVYATGMSSGGHMTYYAGMILQDKLAAIAPISGSIADLTLYPSPTSPGLFDSYQINKPMPICHIHGNADTIVNINGGSWYESWSNIRARWFSFNKISNPPTIIQLPNITQSDGSTVTKFEYRGATIASDVDDYLIVNGGHSIPGIEPSANQDFNAWETIWEFFKKHRLSDPH